uniref:hypothetical protein n=1 Tax=uncultured Draconibacterium sp. TaxID=1573823 RepID=UPI003217776E
MTAKEKKRRAAMIAVAYYLEQEAAQNNKVKPQMAWTVAGKEVIMNNRELVQRLGRMLKSRA